MNLFAKFKETALSVVPVMGIVLVLGLATVGSGGGATSVPAGWIPRFLIGGLLLILGLTVFLLGVDLGIQPMGERCGAALTKRRSLALLLGAAFLIGFIVTAAEPDIQVFGEQVRGKFADVDKRVLVFSIAGGVGLFMVIGLLRTVLGLSVKKVLAISYGLLGILACFARPDFIGIAFDSGGATTGPMTVPFIMALGLGVAAVRKDENGSFGLTGIASVGPIAAVLLYSLFLPGAPAEALPTETAAPAVAESTSLLAPFRDHLGDVFGESLTSLLPLFTLFLVFQAFLLRMTLRQAFRITIGFLYALIGLTVFLLGVNGGFMQAGEILGSFLGLKAAGPNGMPWFLLLLGTGLALGAIIVCAEPAVWVLSEQVEQVSGGAIRRRLLLLFLSAGTALAIGLAMWRAVAGFPLAYILVPGYALALACLVKAPPLFVGIAFDSGGVASGPLTSTFILSFTLGAAAGGKGGTDSFGVIALVAMMPLVAIQIMGILYDRKRKVTAA